MIMILNMPTIFKEHTSFKVLNLWNEFKEAVKNECKERLPEMKKQKGKKSNVKLWKLRRRRREQKKTEEKREFNKYFQRALRGDNKEHYNNISKLKSECACLSENIWR